MSSTSRFVTLACCLLAAGSSMLAAQDPQDVPSDLRPLLAPPESEMRLVVTRYTLDRAMLSGNYAGGAAGGGGGGGGGRAGRGGGRGGQASPAGGAADSTAPVSISKARIARLERFDLSWQTALGRLDAGKFTPSARTDLDSLKGMIRSDLTELDGEATRLAQVMPLVPFAPELVDAIEARIRIKDMDAEKTAAMLTHVTDEIGAIRARLNVGIGGTDSTGATSLRANRDQALKAAAATDVLRANMAEWFRFYDGYDPLFTWWMNLPYKHVDDALQQYAAFLRDKVAPANQTSTVAVGSTQVAPAPESKYATVPNLNEIIALPQDEMTPIVERFFASGAGTRSGGGRGRGGQAAASTDPATLYNAWLAALKTLDFDRLSRNAQVDYLYLKHVSQLQTSRIGKPLPANPPRKADNSGIPGAARGREGLIRDLQDELIPYTPEQLIALAEREFAWCEGEMKKASRQMGLGDDWKRALEKTKTMHPPAGGQPAMIRDLLTESRDYLRLHDLITVPEVDAESQHMIMMTPERQLVNPFFTGGGQMSVSYPTNTMEFDQREQSMRGNNRPWSHATAFHEMIPGHNLQSYYTPRYRDYRANLEAGGPFYGEGWAVYWETILYDKGFDDTPEEKVGALFWRMHRCARIIFSLKFHMGEWSPQEAVDFLIARVGHEPANARAEVLRSFEGGYGPLYQAGYLLGALELRGLRKEIVDTHQMPEKAFHDEIMRQGAMPIALLKAGLSKTKLTPDTPIGEWKFYGDLPSQ